MEFKNYIVNENLTCSFAKLNKFKRDVISFAFILDLDKDKNEALSVLKTLLLLRLKKYNKYQLFDKKVELYNLDYNIYYYFFDDKVMFTYVFEYFDPKLINDDNYTIDNIYKFIKEVIFNPHLNYKERIFNTNYFKKELKSFIQEVELDIKQSRYQHLLKEAIEQNEVKDDDFNLEVLNVEKLKNLTNRELYDLYFKIINADLMIKGILNDEPSKVINNLKKYFKNHTFKGVLTKNNYNHKLINSTQKVKHLDTQGALILDYKIDYDMYSKDYYAALIFDRILGGSINSLLFEIVREKHGLCYNVRSYLYPKSRDLVIYGELNKDNYLKFINIVKEILDDLRKGKIKQKAIDEAVKQVYLEIVGNYDHPRLSLKRELIFSLENRDSSLDKVKERFSNIHKEDLRKIACSLKFNWQGETIYE